MSAVAGVLVGGYGTYVSDGKGTSNEGTPATAKKLAKPVPPTKAGKTGMQGRKQHQLW
jgi:hypothetical protein